MSGLMYNRRFHEAFQCILFMSRVTVFSSQPHQGPTFICIDYIFDVRFFTFFVVISLINLLRNITVASGNGNHMSAAGLVSLFVRTRLRI